MHLPRLSTRPLIVTAGQPAEVPRLSRSPDAALRGERPTATAGHDCSGPRWSAATLHRMPRCAFLSWALAAPTRCTMLHLSVCSTPGLLSEPPCTTRAGLARGRRCLGFTGGAAVLVRDYGEERVV